MSTRATADLAAAEPTGSDSPAADLAAADLAGADLAGAEPTAPDGSPVEAYTVLPPGNAPAVIHRALGPGASVLELGCGAGRVTHPLLALGHLVVAVDQSPAMLAHVRGAEVVLADIETLDLGRRFDGVVLASQLVNTVDDDQRAAFLSSCRRHIHEKGSVLIQRYDPEWAADAVDSTSEADGIRYRLAQVHVDHQPDHDRLSAVVSYETGGRRWQHLFTARILDDAALEGDLRGADLRPVRWLDDRRTWLQAAALAPGTGVGA